MAKVNLNGGAGILPPLGYLIDKISKKRPEFEYVSIKQTDTNMVCKVRVFEGGLFIGELSYAIYNGKQKKNGDTPPAFTIFSDNIKKARGKDRTIVTSNPGAAVRAVIRYFKPPTPATIISDLLVPIPSEVSSIRYKALYAMRAAVSYLDDEVRGIFIEHALFNKPLRLPKLVAIKSDAKEIYMSHIAAKQLDSTVPTNPAGPKGQLVQFMQNDEIHVIELSKAGVPNMELDQVLQKYSSFDALPRYLQDKIAVLKIATAGEPILNIGCRLDIPVDAFPRFLILDDEVKEEHLESDDEV